MKIYKKRLNLWTILSILPFVALPASLCLADDELIPPTRSLTVSEQTPGTLTVTSEPPGLEVFLDGSGIGQTPVRLSAVKRGLHALSIEQAKTDIHVRPGESTRISFFKGSFIVAPEEKGALKQLEARQDRQALNAAGEVALPTGGEETDDLTPWQRFLNRTAPNF